MIDVAVIGYDTRLTTDALRMIARQEDAKLHGVNIAIRNEHRYIAIYNAEEVKGHLFDCLILVDDYRWHITRDERIEAIMRRLKDGRLPKELAIQYIEI